MVQVPKYVEKMLIRRRNLALKLIDACVDVDEYCQKIGIPICDKDSCLCTNILIYTEPEVASDKTRTAIIRQLL